DATILANDIVCSYAINQAAVPIAGPGAQYDWTLTNATILANHGSYVNFRPDSEGPVELHVTVTAAGGCSNSGSRTITGEVMPLVTFSIPTNVCQRTGLTASMSDAGAGVSYLWTVAYGGTITSDPTQRSITFNIDPNYGAIRLNAFAHKGDCWQSTSKSVN